MRKPQNLSSIRRNKRILKIVGLGALVIIFFISLAVVIYPFWPLIRYQISSLSNRELIDNIPEEPPVENEETVIEDSTSSVEQIENLLVIPKIGVRIPIVEGSTESALEYGAWRLPAGSTPDKGSNTALAAHRFKYVPPHEETFYLLDKLVIGDTFHVYWNGKKYYYKIVSSEVVPANAIEVLDPTSTPTVTLITCYPLFSAEKRLIVKGEIIGN